MTSAVDDSYSTYDILRDEADVRYNKMSVAEIPYRNYFYISPNATKVEALEKETGLQLHNPDQTWNLDVLAQFIRFRFVVGSYDAAGPGGAHEIRTAYNFR